MMFKVGDKVKTNVGYEYSHRHSIIGVVTDVERNFSSNTIFVTVRCESISGPNARQFLIGNEIVLLRNDLQLYKKKSRIA